MIYLFVKRIRRKSAQTKLLQITIKSRQTRNLHPCRYQSCIDIYVKFLVFACIILHYFCFILLLQSCFDNNNFFFFFRLCNIRYVKDFLCANSKFSSNEVQQMLNELTLIAKTIGKDVLKFSYLLLINQN